MRTRYCVRDAGEAGVRDDAAGEHVVAGRRAGRVRRQQVHLLRPDADEQLVAARTQRSPRHGDLLPVAVDDDDVAAAALDAPRRDEVGLAEEVRDERRPRRLVEVGRACRAARSARAFMTATVSAIVMASSWSCVTCTNVMPTSVWIRLSSICIWRRSLRSSAPSGSSSSSTRGRLTIARASAMRCCWPPESWAGLRRARCPSCDQVERLAPPGCWTSLTPRRAQAERDVLVDVQVREQRVALEHRVHRPLVRLAVRDVEVAEVDRARRSAPRARRPCAASWSCRSPRGRAARRTIPAAPSGAGRRPRRSRRSAC